MRQGQSTLEYILLIGIAAVGLIVMLVYVSRGQQGRLRSQAEQLSIEQYAPGNTSINNSQQKRTGAIVASGSTTTVAYGNMRKPIEVGLVDFNGQGLMVSMNYDGVLDLFRNQQSAIYTLNQEFEDLIVSEGLSRAVYASTNGLDTSSLPDIVPWPPEVPGLEEKNNEISEARSRRGYLSDLLQGALDAQPEPTPDSTKSSSYSTEKGTEGVRKRTSEDLGSL
jgi:hypothetical protein